MPSTPTIGAVLRGEARWAVVHADCLAELPLFSNDSIDHVITDPPYSEHVHEKASRGHGQTLADGNGHFTKAAYGRRVELGFDALSDGLRLFASQHFARVCKRWCLVFSDPESAHLWRQDLEHYGLRHMRMGFWDKVGSTPQFTGDRPSSACEAIMIHHPPGRAKWNGGGKRGIWSVPIVVNRSGHRNDREHTTQKPLELMTALIEDFTDPDDLVLDPFAGSGTTGVACLRLGRRFIGIEKDPKYAALARERLVAESRGQTLATYRAGQQTLFGKAGGT